MHSKFLFLYLLLFLCFYSLPSSGQIKEFYITCNPDDFAYIYENYNEDIYVPITLGYLGIEWHDAYMRIRGDNSRRFPKKSLKIKFSGEPFLNGRNRLNFNAEYEDTSYIRSFIATQVFKMAGQTCFSAEHIRLYLNGNFLGLYVMIENVDSQFLEANNYDPQGSFYKAAVDGACLSIHDDLENFWEQKAGAGNKEDLAQFIADINQVSIDDYKDFCSYAMNYEQVVNIIACNMVTSNTSTYYHNYYMFHDANGTRLWEMMPWDLDKTFTVNAWRNHTYSSPPWTSDNPFLEKAILNHEMMSDIRGRVNEIFQDIFTSEIFIPIIDSLVNVLQPSVLQDTTDNIPDLDVWMIRIQKEIEYLNVYSDRLNWFFDNVQSSFISEGTAGVYPPDINFKWSPSIDPNGAPVCYTFLLTTGKKFQPELTQVFENIQDTFLTLENLPEGNYFWKVISHGESEQEVESFDSRNPLTVKNMEVMPCIISEDITISKDSSPYLINCKVFVEPQATLTIEEGVTLYIENYAQLTIAGGFQVNGTVNQPVHILPARNAKAFDSLRFVDPQQNIEINHLIVTDGVIYSQNANLKLNHCALIHLNNNLNESKNLLHHQFGDLEFINSIVIGNETGNGIKSEFSQSVIISNSTFENTDKAIKLFAVQNGEIKNSQIKTSTGEGILVIDSENVIVENNSLFDCTQAIAIASEMGELDSVIIQKNLIVNCDTGILVYNGGLATLNKNTFYANETGISLMEKMPGFGGGQATVVNTIFSSNYGAVVSADEQSGYTITYSISDTEMIEGDGNLFGEPKFISAAGNDFQLHSSSPCIDSGDPSGAYDPDDTRADMGAFYFNQGDYNVVFNEINYRSSPDFDTEDWVELYNADTITANISGWQFKDENDDHIYIFPYNTQIEPGGYLVLCRNAAMFSENHPDVSNFIGDFDFGLSSNGELIRLFNNSGELINYVTYGITVPWPTEPNGQGSTLELISPKLDNRLAENWCASENYGTPAAVNSCYVNTIINEDKLPFRVAFFPNPASDHAFVQINHFTDGHVFIKLFSSDGKLIFSTDKEAKGAGEFVFELQLMKAKGLCILLVDFSSNNTSHTSTVKFIAH
jgi:hypothetical protein